MGWFNELCKAVADGVMRVAVAVKTEPVGWFVTVVCTFVIGVIVGVGL